MTIGQDVRGLPSVEPAPESVGRTARLHVPALLLAVVAWLPLLVVSAIEGNATGGRGAFLTDVAAHVRFLFVVPLLWELRSRLDERVALAVDYLGEARLLDDARFARLRSAAATVIGPRWQVRYYVVALALGFLMSGGQHLRPGAAVAGTWQVLGDGNVSLAGHVRGFVSVPLSNALFVVCALRFVLWAVTLVRAAPVLALMPTHPDRYFGLYVFVRTPGDFWPLLFALSATLAAALGTLGYRGGGTVRDFELSIAAFVVVAPLVFVTPLVLLTVPIMRARRLALRSYAVAVSNVARRYAGKLERMRTEPSFTIEGDAYSWDADMGGSFERLVDSRIVPIPTPAVARLVLAAVVPMLILVFAQLPLAQALEVLAHFKEIFV